jgi:hypothetical protein
MEEQDECCICLNTLKYNKRFQLPWKRPYRLKCNHSFHKSCIRKWSKVNRKCPLCQEPFINTYYGYMLAGNNCLVTVHKLFIGEHYVQIYKRTIHYSLIKKVYTYFNTLVIVEGEDSIVYLHRNIHAIQEIFQRLAKKIKEHKKSRLMSVV